MKFAKSGVVSPDVRDAVTGAEIEAETVLAALGGIDNVSPQRMLLVRDLARAGVIARVVFGRLLREGVLENDAIGKITSIFRSRTSTMIALGLDRAQRDALDLKTYLASRAAAPAAEPEVLEAEALEPEVLG